jgi:hypothetical protein
MISQGGMEKIKDVNTIPIKVETLGEKIIS